jgi:hypothetical protein
MQRAVVFVQVDEYVEHVGAIYATTGAV